MIRNGSDELSNFRFEEEGGGGRGRGVEDG